MSSDIFIESNAAEISADIARIAQGIKDPMLTKVIEGAKNNALRLFRGTVRTWTRKPRFEADVNVSGDTVEMIAGTDDRIYSFVNFGTKPHIIRPRRAKALAFFSKYRAKTQPGSLKSGPGGASGNRVFAKFVNHPGFKGRRFTDEVARLTEEKLSVDLPKSVDRLLRSNGRNA